MLKRTVWSLLAVSAAVLFLSACGAQGGKIIRQMTVNASGVKFELYWNGKPVPYLSTDNLIGLAVSGPLNRLAEVLPGKNTLTVKIQEVDPAKDAFIDINLDEFVKGQVVDTSNPQGNKTLFTASIGTQELSEKTEFEYTLSID